MKEATVDWRVVRCTPREFIDFYAYDNTFKTKHQEDRGDVDVTFTEWAPVPSDSDNALTRDVSFRSPIGAPKNLLSLIGRTHTRITEKQVWYRDVAEQQLADSDAHGVLVFKCSYLPDIQTLQQYFDVQSEWYVQPWTEQDQQCCRVKSRVSVRFHMRIVGSLFEAFMIRSAAWSSRFYMEELVKFWSTTPLVKNIAAETTSTAHQRKEEEEEEEEGERLAAVGSSSSNNNSNNGSHSATADLSLMTLTDLEPNSDNVTVAALQRKLQQLSISLDQTAAAIKLQISNIQGRRRALRIDLDSRTAAVADSLSHAGIEPAASSGGFDEGAASGTAAGDYTMRLVKQIAGAGLLLLTLFLVWFRWLRKLKLFPSR